MKSYFKQNIANIFVAILIAFVFPAVVFLMPMVLNLFQSRPVIGPVDLNDNISCYENGMYLREVKFSRFAGTRRVDSRFISFFVIIGTCVNDFSLKRDYTGFMVFEVFNDEFKNVGICNSCESCKKINFPIHARRECVEDDSKSCFGVISKCGHDDKFIDKCYDCFGGIIGNELEFK